MAVFGHPDNSAYPPWAPAAKVTTNSKSNKFFPDLHDNFNCILDNNYDEWMMEDGFTEYYLFDQGSDCCKMW